MVGLDFTKMTASGNDFIVIDNRNFQLSVFDYSLGDIAKRLCQRKFSIGADGLLIIEYSKKADFRMRIFNPDGSEVNMCGNGSRCVALYAVENGICQKELKIETKAGIIEAEVVGLRVKLRLTLPKDMRLNRRLKIDNKFYKIHLIDTGVPHVVYFCRNVDRIDVENLGRRIRFHKRFKPEGTNVNFVEVLNESEIKIRTYERGVESETYACGTGAVASAVVTCFVHKYNPHFDVRTKGRDILRVYCDINPKNKKTRIANLFLEAEAKTVYKGRLVYV